MASRGSRGRRVRARRRVTGAVGRKATAEQVRRKVERRRSGASGTHLDRRDRRARTRAARLDRALGDE